MRGKSLVFTDIHFGINSDKPSRQKIASDVVDEIVGVCEVNKINQIFFLGDLFHHRTSIEVSTLNLADAAITKLASCANLYLVQGNHDLYEKSGRSLSSTAIFAKHHATVVAKPMELELNGQSLLLAPWCGDGQGVTIEGFVNACGVKLSKSKYDLLMGHFAVTDAVDIEKAYSKIKGTLLKNETGAGAIFTNGESAASHGDSQGVELFTYTHPGSQVFLGHIHEHQERILGNRLFHVVGSPQMQTHDLKGLDPDRKRHGYYILDEMNRPEFFETRCAPKFVTIYASEIRSPTTDTKKKLESLKGCIVKRCYDCSLSDEKQKEFDEVVGSAAPLEEDSAAFIDSKVSMTEESIDVDSGVQNEIKALSKEEYFNLAAEKAIKESKQGLSEKDYIALHKKVVDRLSSYLSSISGK